MADQHEQPGSHLLPGGLSRNLEEVIACAALLGVVLATAWGVFTRYVTASPATWTVEIAAAAFCWMIFIGSAAAFKRGIHISIDMLVLALPRSAARMIMIGVDLLVFGFLAWVSWLTIEFTIESWSTPTPALRWPYAFHYAGAAIGLILMTLRHAIAARTRWATAAET